MKSSLSNITGILLAGGKSKRMGREKGTLEIGKRKLYEYPLGVLENVCDEILISSCSDPAPITGYKVLCDETKGIGPMGGIYTCLSQSKTDLNIVLSYDMPLVSEALLRYLLDQSHDWETLIPALKPNKPEPLCAVYRKSTLDTFRELIKREQYAVHQVIRTTRSKVILIGDDLPFYQADLFLNINQQTDLDRLPSDFSDE